MTSSTEARRAASSAPRGTSKGTRFSASVRLARTMRCAMVGSATRKARAISSVVRPPISRRVSATRASVAKHRMAGGEDQAQQVVADVVVERGIEVGRCAFAVDLELAAELLVLALHQLGAAQPVDGAVLGRGHQPGAGLVGDAGLRPLLERGDERVLRQLLGQPDVAHHARQAGDQPRLLDPEYRFDGACVSVAVMASGYSISSPQVQGGRNSHARAARCRLGVMPAEREAREPVPRATYGKRCVCGPWVPDISLTAKFRDDRLRRSRASQSDHCFALASFHTSGRGAG